jgi:hypothetical protein
MHHDFYVNDQVLFLIIFSLHHVTLNRKKIEIKEKKIFIHKYTSKHKSCQCEHKISIDND